ncbi:glycoside hydrolase family 15 protein [Tumebacillus flagellatus]|nr:glycoside hydrolase family 15 protein [Tumebacillus flagellatus]
MTDIQSKPYLIDSVIGNGRILACLTASGELVRAFWPTIDYAQHINKTQAALRLNGAGELHVLNGGAFVHGQRYVPDTNVVETTYSSTGLPVGVVSYDFAAADLDVIVRQYHVTNNGSEALDVDLLYTTDFHMEESPIYQSVLYDNQTHAIGHYRRKYWALIGGADRPFGFQVGNVAQSLHNRRLNGYSGPATTLGSDGAQVFTATLQPGETVQFPIFIAFGHNRDEAAAALTSARVIGADGLRKQAEQAAADFLARGRRIATGIEGVDTMYRRSLLVFSLMADAVYGGLIAAPEFDPFYTKCGGYGYCWGRDAGYITTAIDMAGYHDIGRKFYEWAMKAQDADGSWDHRHYMNGDLAPAWGYQADEPASILWGMWQHFLITGDEEFLKVCYPSMERGAEHLLATLAENGMPKASMDLWEERFAQHTYSSAAVAASLFAVADAAKHLGHGEQASRYTSAAETIRGEVEKLFNVEKQSWYRGVNLFVPEHEYNKRKEAGLGVHTVQDEHGYDRFVADYDTIVDASLLGMSYPFALFDAEHPSVTATAQAVRELCTQKGVGGIRRYEDDHYAGGNPWVLCTLWLGLDANRRNDGETVQEVLEWVLDNQTATGLLPEQVDKDHGGPGWVVPLTWSHAMYVLTVLEHYGK